MNKNRKYERETESSVNWLHVFSVKWLLLGTRIPTSRSVISNGKWTQAGCQICKKCASFPFKFSREASIGITLCRSLCYCWGFLQQWAVRGWCQKNEKVFNHYLMCALFPACQKLNVSRLFIWDQLVERMSWLLFSKQRERERRLHLFLKPHLLC